MQENDKYFGNGVLGTPMERGINCKLQKIANSCMYITSLYISQSNALGYNGLNPPFVRCLHSSPTFQTFINLGAFLKLMWNKMHKLSCFTRQLFLPKFRIYFFFSQLSPLPSTKTRVTIIESAFK